MFDIAFSEMLIIAVVALVVIGPERLPRVARTVGHLFGRLQRYVNDVKADINREIELDELRKFKNEFEQAAQSVQTEVTGEMQKVQESFESVATEASSLAHGEPQAAATAAEGFPAQLAAATASPSEAEPSAPPERKPAA
jgi:sec-independent protein translocase protein TatB